MPKLGAKQARYGFQSDPEDVQCHLLVSGCRRLAICGAVCEYVRASFRPWAKGDVCAEESLSRSGRPQLSFLRILQPRKRGKETSKLIWEYWTGSDGCNLDCLRFLVVNYGVYRHAKCSRCPLVSRRLLRAGGPTRRSVHRADQSMRGTGWSPVSSQLRPPPTRFRLFEPSHPWSVQALTTLLTATPNPGGGRRERGAQDFL